MSRSSASTPLAFPQTRPILHPFLINAPRSSGVFSKNCQSFKSGFFPGLFPLSSGRDSGCIIHPRFLYSIAAANISAIIPQPYLSKQECVFLMAALSTSVFCFKPRYCFNSSNKSLSLSVNSIFTINFSFSIPIIISNKIYFFISVSSCPYQANRFLILYKSTTNRNL